MMGCLFIKSKKNDHSSSKDLRVKEYSWDSKRNINPKDFIIEGETDTIIWKPPGSINGQQFVIENCKNSIIYILDHTNTVNIDDCIKCKIILGPVKGSVFVRDSKECVCVVACGQFRMRDCRRLDVFLSCNTQPIIESSTGIHFGCYQLYYNKINEHFKTTGLSVFNNNWSNIHDFTSVQGETNWCILPQTMSIHDYLREPSSQSNDDMTDKTLNISYNIESTDGEKDSARVAQPFGADLTYVREKSIVPLTAGIHTQTDEESEICLVIFFCTGNEEWLAKLFIQKLYEDRQDCVLLNTRKVHLEPRDAEIVFGTSAYNKTVQNGDIIGLIYSGSRCIYSCQKTMDCVAAGNSSRVYISSNPKTSQFQLDKFNSLATIQLTL